MTGANMDRFPLDDELLKREFRIREPERVPGLTERLETGAKPIRILFSYDERPPGGKKAGHAPHIRCAFGHPHWKGFVVEIEDGRKALVGEHCAKEHFGREAVDYIRERFEAERGRQFELRRLIAVRAALPDALIELRSLASSPAVTQFDDYWARMIRQFGKMSRELARTVRTSHGRLLAMERVYDEEKTIAAAKIAARELAGWDESCLFEKAETEDDPEERRIAVARMKKFIDRQPKQYKLEPVDMGPCEAWQLANAADRAKPSELIARAVAIGKRLDLSRPTERWAKRDFVDMRRELEAVFANVDRAARLVADLDRFTSAENLQRVAAWAQQVEVVERKIGQEVHAEGRSLVGSTRLALAEPYFWPATPSLDCLRAALKNVPNAV